MKSRTSAILLPALLAGWGGGELAAARAASAPAAQDDGAPPPAEGPQGSSQLRPGEQRYDRVGYAGHAEGGEGVYALSGDLPAGSFAEVTALDSGKTILIQVRGQGRGLIELSAAAARQLGVTGTPAVRVRRVSVTPQDSALLAAGRAAPPRADAPPALLAGLRRRLKEQPPGQERPAPAVTTVTPQAPSRPAASPPRQPSRAVRGLFVQVAALSSAQRARALADQLGGVVHGGGGLHRVRLGPFADAAAARRARADAARRGYPDARIVSVP